LAESEVILFRKYFVKKYGNKKFKGDALAAVLKMTSNISYANIFTTIAR
jgi:hypothetical protein